MISPARKEKLILQANGPENNRVTLAARRVLERRGIGWKILQVCCPRCGMPSPCVSEGYEGNTRELEFKCKCGYDWWIPAYFISTGKIVPVV